MARITTPLTDTQIKTAKPNGSKIWRFNYYRPITKVRSLISFGGYPEI